MTTRRDSKGRFAKKQEPVAEKGTDVFGVDRMDAAGWVSRTTYDRMLHIALKLSASVKGGLEGTVMEVLRTVLAVQNLPYPKELPLDWYLNQVHCWQAGKAAEFCASGDIPFGVSLRSAMLDALVNWRRSDCSWMAGQVHDIHMIEMASAGLFNVEDMVTEYLFNCTGLDYTDRNKVQEAVQKRLVSYARGVVDGRIKLASKAGKELRLGFMRAEDLIMADAGDYLNSPGCDCIGGDCF